MTWFKVDDSFADHPKVLALLEERRGPHAIALWTLAGSWSSKQLKNGFVSSSVVKRLGFGPRDAALLVSVGLWENAEGGYVFHDWEHCNPTREQVEQRREKSRNKVKSWREKRERNQVTEPECNPVTNEACNQSGNPAPVPTRPVPTRPDLEESLRGSAPAELTPAATTLAKRKPRPKGEPPPSSATWDAYAAAYRERYGAEPVRNARVNGQLAQLVQRIPADDAPAVAAHYLRSNNARYVSSGHSVGCLLQDAEKLRTEWITGRQVTASGARKADAKAERGQMWTGLIARFEQEDAANG